MTVATRATPFLIFRDHDKTPKFVFYLGKVLPLAIMGMLIIYCVKGSFFIAYPYTLPELIGTAVYMILVQFVFV